MYQRICELHAKTRQQGQQNGAFADDVCLSVAERTPKDDPCEGGRGEDEGDVAPNLYGAERGACDIGNDGNRLVSTQHPCTPVNLNAQAYGSDDDGNEGP